MLSVTASIVVPAPPERVWELISDTRRYAEWVEGTEVLVRTDGTARAGSTYEELNPIVGPWKATTSWKVVEFTPPRRQVHTSSDVPLSSRFDVVMELHREGEATSFTLTLRGTPSLGPVGRFFDRLMQGVVERDNQKTVENLVELVRREPATAPSA